MALYPIGSMYGIYANIWGILMVNVTIYSIHGSYGYIPAVPVPEMAIGKYDGTETYRNIPNDDGNRWKVSGKFQEKKTSGMIIDSS